MTAALPSDWSSFKVCTICAALIRQQFLVLPLFHHENLSLTQPALEHTVSHSGTELSKQSPSHCLRLLCVWGVGWGRRGGNWLNFYGLHCCFPHSHVETWGHLLVFL